MRLLVRTLFLSYVITLSLQATSLSIPSIPANLWLKKKTNTFYDMQKRVTPIVYGGILIAGFSLSAALLAYSVKKTIEKKCDKQKQISVKKYSINQSSKIGK